MEKVRFMDGFLLGAYAHALALKYNTGDKYAATQLIADIPIAQLILEVTGWYLQTASFSTPLYLVIYARGRTK